MEAIPGISRAVFATWFGGVYQKPSNFFAQMAVVPEDFMEMFPEYVLSEEEKQAWMSTRSGAVVGETTAKRFGWEVGDQIPLRATIWIKKDGSETWEFDLVGIYEGAEIGTDASQFFFHHQYLDEARVFGEGQVGWYWVRVDNPDDAVSLANQIDEKFANSPYETKTEPEGAFVQGFAKQIGNIGAIMTFILSAVFFTILLVAGNTMAQAVRERIQELAVLKAVGYTDRSVMVLVLAESCFMALLGGLLGLVVAWWLISLGDPSGGSLPVFFMPTQDLAIGVVLAMLLGLTAGILPALQAQRLEIADALRR
jgi:putative ABC transport system permease protein